MTHQLKHKKRFCLNLYPPPHSEVLWGSVKIILFHKFSYLCQIRLGRLELFLEKSLSGLNVIF